MRMEEGVLWLIPVLSPGPHWPSSLPRETGFSAALSPTSFLASGLTLPLADSYEEPRGAKPGGVTGVHSVAGLTFLQPWLAFCHFPPDGS